MAVVANQYQRVIIKRYRNDQGQYRMLSDENYNYGQWSIYSLSWQVFLA